MLRLCQTYVASKYFMLQMFHGAQTVMDAQPGRGELGAGRRGAASWGPADGGTRARFTRAGCAAVWTRVAGAQRRGQDARASQIEEDGDGLSGRRARPSGP
jgi:hypothetical protein